MRLTLSCDSVWKASFTDETGSLLYKFNSSPFPGPKENITLQRAGPSGKMNIIGQLVYNKFDRGKSRLKFTSDLTEDSEGVLIGDLLHESGPAGVTYGSYPSHSFSTPDGTQYEWVFGYRECSLHSASTNSDSSRSLPVIKFQHKIFKLMSKSRPTTLDVDDGYESILDMALLTLAYLEKSRREENQKKKRGFGIAAALQVQ